VSALSTLDFPTLEIVCVRTAHPGFCAKTLETYYDNETVLVLHLVIWVGNDAPMTIQKTKSRVGKIESGGGEGF